MTTAEVGVAEVHQAVGALVVVTTRYDGTSAKLASGAMIGMATVARPDDEGMRNEMG